MKIASGRFTSNERNTVPAVSSSSESDRFSRLLDSKRNDELNANSDQHSNAALPTDIPWQFSLATPAPVQAGDSVGAEAPVDVQRLVSEIVQRISQQGDARSQNVEIQFHSQVLDGLRVQLQSQQNALWVSFSTQREDIVAALRSHLDELSRALKLKGFRTERLVVNLHSPSFMPRVKGTGR